MTVLNSLPRHRALFLAAGLALLTVAGPLRAASVQWNTSGTGNWNVAGNWTGSAVPTQSDAVTLQNVIYSSPNMVVIPESYSASYSSLRINSNSNHFTTLDVFGWLIGDSAVIDSRGEVRVRGGTWFNLGAAVVGSGAGSFIKITEGGYFGTVSLNIGNSGSGAVSVTSGTLYATEDLTVSSPGAASFTVDGGLAMTRAGIVGPGGGANGTVTVSSGTWRIANDLTIAGIHSSGTVSVTGGLLEVGGLTYVGLDPSYSKGTVYLGGVNFNRGTLSTSGVVSAGTNFQYTGSNAFVMDGGILQARADQSDFITGFRPGDVRIGANGAFVDTNGYAIGISPSLSGSGGLTKLGVGSLTLSGANTYTGATTIRSGTFTVAGSINQANSNFFVGQNNGDNAVLRIAGGSVTNLAGFVGYIGGTGLAEVTGGGSWTNTGSLYVGNGGNSSLLVDNGSVSAYEAYLGYSNTGGTTTVTKGTLSTGFMQVGSYSGTGRLLINGGLVSVSGATTIGYDAGGVVTITSGTWNNSGNVLLGDSYFTSSGSGRGRLEMSGGVANVSGTMILGGYTNVGTIALSGSSGQRGVLSTARVVESTGSGSVTFDGGILRARGNESDFISGFETGEVTIGSGGAFIDSNGYAVGISAPLSGGGGLTKQGGGTLTLSGSNSYTGGTVIEGGTLRLGHARALGASGGLTVQAGTLDLNGQSLTVTSLSGSSGAVITQGSGGPNTLIVNQNTDTTYAGRLQDGSGALYLVKSGTGTLTLTGSSSYTGETEIIDGTLLVMGDISQSALITIDDRSTLGGTGKVGDVHVLDLGIVAPGASPGLLTIDDLTMDANAFLVMEFTGTGGGAFDQLQVNGLFSAAGAILELDVSYAAQYGDSFEIFTGNLPTFGAFTIETNLTGGLTWDISQLSSAGIVSVVPEPTTYALSALGVICLLARRRRDQQSA